MPFGAVKLTILTRVDFVAVGKQDGEILLRPAHLHSVGGEHIGAVGEEGYAPETFGLALGAEHARRGIETHQLRIGGWVDLGHDLDRVPIAFERDDQIVAVHHVPGTVAAVAF